ncbi:MAG: CHAD domain-containing protein [Pirellulales bacterium]|nr:CHAD domain-containing protein [Pirellulales bacterium]
MAKWIDDVRPDQPVSELARRALDLRLSSVWHYLPLASQLAAEEIEHVHQLRVSTRRAAATVRLFRDLLPKRRRRWLAKQLRRIRRAAAEARDFDVLEERLPHWAGDTESEEIRDELKKVHDCRLSAQGPIVEVHRRLRRKDFPGHVAELVKRTRWRDERSSEPTVAVAARERLHPFVEDFFATAGTDPPDAASLHRLRIRGKRLRYAMEVLGGSFDRSFRELLYPQIEELQERLGDINDRAAAIERFERWSADRQSNRRQRRLRHLLEKQQATFEQSRQEFLGWWTPERIARLADQFAIAMASAALGMVDAGRRQTDGLSDPSHLPDGHPQNGAPTELDSDAASCSDTVSDFRPQVIGD